MRRGRELRPLRIDLLDPHIEPIEPKLIDEIAPRPSVSLRPDRPRANRAPEHIHMRPRVREIEPDFRARTRDDPKEPEEKTPSEPPPSPPGELDHGQSLPRSGTKPRQARRVSQQLRSPPPRTPRMTGAGPQRP